MQNKMFVNAIMFIWNNLNYNITSISKTVQYILELDVEFNKTKLVLSDDFQLQNRCQ